MKVFHPSLAILLFVMVSNCAPAGKVVVREDSVTPAVAGAVSQMSVLVPVGNGHNGDGNDNSGGGNNAAQAPLENTPAESANTESPSEDDSFIASAQKHSSAMRRRSVVMTSNTVSTSDGPVTENCQIQLTPNSDGEYTEVQICDVSIQPNNNDDSAGPTTPSPPTMIPSTPDPIPTVSSPPPSAPSPSLSSSPLSAPSPSSSPPASPPSSSPSPSPSPSSSAPVSAVSDPAAPSPSPTNDNSDSGLSTSSPSSGGVGASIVGTGVTSLDPAALASASAALSSVVPAISAAADNTSTFTMPGRQISVLPVGLAVFAGISVIALIVVGAVTYERTKYRKNFRRRQLAEQIKARTEQMSERPMMV